MTIKERLQADIKKSMLAGDKQTAQALQSIKSAILYVEVEANKREDGLSDDEVIQVLAKEAKKRQESIDLYTQGNNTEQAEAEAFEKTLIEKYLPEQLSTEELQALVEATIAKVDNPTMKDMGQIIGAVKKEAGPAVDGGELARIVKESLQQ